MYKKLILSISIILLILVIGLVGYYWYISKDNSGTSSPKNVFQNFFPFGGSDSGNNTNTGEGDQNQNPITDIPNENHNFAQKLRKISTDEVSGAGSADFKAGTVVRYIERATGHIYEVELFSPKQVRISNTTIPLAYSALWNASNDSLIAQYLKEDDQTVDTYTLSLKNLSTSTESTIEGKILPRNISDLSSFGNSVFYLVQNLNTSSGYIANFDGSKSKKIWESDLKEVVSQYVNSKTVALTTKPAQNVPGYLYFVDTTGGAPRKILGNIPGLSTLASPDASKVLYLSQGNNIGMYLFDIKSKNNVSLTPITFPEKCVWSTKNKNTVYCAVSQSYINANSLTLWYKGLVSFTDDIWRFNIASNTATLIENLSTDSGMAIDVIKPQLSQNEQYLIFINKIDNSLWSLDLAQIASTTAQ